MSWLRIPPDLIGDIGHMYGGTSCDIGFVGLPELASTLDRDRSKLLKTGSADGIDRLVHLNERLTLSHRDGGQRK